MDAGARWVLGRWGALGDVCVYVCGMVNACFHKTVAVCDKHFLDNHMMTREDDSQHKLSGGLLLGSSKHLPTHHPLLSTMGRGFGLWQTAV